MSLIVMFYGIKTVMQNAVDEIRWAQKVEKVSKESAGIDIAISELELYEPHLTSVQHAGSSEQGLQLVPLNVHFQKVYPINIIGFAKTIYGRNTYALLIDGIPLVHRGMKRIVDFGIKYCLCFLIAYPATKAMDSLVLLKGFRQGRKTYLVGLEAIDNGSILHDRPDVSCIFSDTSANIEHSNGIIEKKSLSDKGQQTNFAASSDRPSSTVIHSVPGEFKKGFPGGLKKRSRDKTLDALFDAHSCPPVNHLAHSTPKIGQIQGVIL